MLSRSTFFARILAFIVLMLPGRTIVTFGLPRTILILPRSTTEALGFPFIELILSRKTIFARHNVIAGTGFKKFALGALRAVRYVDLVFSFRAKGAVRLVGFVPYAEFARNTVQDGVANKRLVFLAVEVLAVVSVLQSRAFCYVCATCFSECDCGRVICLAGTVPETLKLIDIGLPLSLAVAE